MKVFVIHYHKLVERKKRISMSLTSVGMDAEFVEHHACFHNKYEKMLDSIKAITLSHLYCYREIASKYDYSLILEDDAVICDSFKSKLDDYMAQLPHDWDMLFIGDGCGFHIPSDIVNASDGNIFKKCREPTSWGGNGATRCVDSYIVSKKCAQIIISQKEQIGKGIDWWLNQVIRDCELNIYWAEPTLVTQGSQNSLYTQSWM